MQEQNIAQMLENPFMQYNHIEIVSVTSDSAVMSLDIRRDTTNIYGYVHGGAFFTMADCCAGLTALSSPHCARFACRCGAFLLCSVFCQRPAALPGNILNRQQPAFRRGDPAVQLPQHQLDTLPRHILHGQIDYAQARD